MSKKYIGVDLGAWYGNKTSIAILEENENNLILESIKKETTKSSEKPHIRNRKLIDDLKKYAGQNALFGIDSPFAIPYYLCNPLEDEDITKSIYNPNNTIKGELSNQLIFDNSARFVYEKTNQIALAPAGDKIGKITARMLHIIEVCQDNLHIIKDTKLDQNKEKFATVEVFPTTTIFKLAQSQNCLSNYFKTKNNTEKYDKNKRLEIKSYKGDNFIGKNDKESNKARMLKLIEKYIKITEEQKHEIKSDDDYDAIICALTAYLIDKYGYEKPNNEDLDKFTNSFIYIPKI